MKRMFEAMSMRTKILLGVFAILIGFIFTITGIMKNSLGEEEYGIILSLEHVNPVYENEVEMLTQWSELGLPSTLRAILDIHVGENTLTENEILIDDGTKKDMESPEDESPEEKTDDVENGEPSDIEGDEEEIMSETKEVTNIGAELKEAANILLVAGSMKTNLIENEEVGEPKGFEQTDPSDSDIDPALYGYTAPSDEATARSLNQFVIYTYDHGDGTNTYRVYGTYNGTDEAFYACDEYGNIYGIVEDIPVTWDGVYDNDLPGIYVLEAQFEGYIYEGEAPTAIITVLPDEIEENGNLFAMPMRNGPTVNTYTIDLSDLVTGSYGPGWNYSTTQNVKNGGTGTITFDSNASNSIYNIIKSVAGTATIARDIVIPNNVNNITIVYDGDNILMNKVGANPYTKFTSDVSINGGISNSVIFQNTLSLSISTVTVASSAENTSVRYIGVSHAAVSTTSGEGTFKFNNNGINSELFFSGSNIRNFYADQVTAVLNTTIRTGGTNKFAIFESKMLSGTSMKLLLDGSTVVDSGFITVPAGSNLTIDSDLYPGTETGSISLTKNNSSFAVIGSTMSTDSGLITINGGTVTATQLTTATSYAAAIGGGYQKKGTVIINGGKVIASAIDGAAIGGGPQTTGLAVGVGDVTINGGTVIAKVSGNGAGIGGGAYAPGFVTINGGNVTITRTGSGGGAAIGGGHSADGTATINGGIIDANNGPSSNGAAIGGGINKSGYVTVTGGKIKATTEQTGSAIGGGGAIIGSIPGVAYVTISGGDMTLRSLQGACVGNGGIPHSSGASASKIGFVTITGGKIFGDFSYGCIVGAGWNNVAFPVITIDTGADIVGFGRIVSNTPGINFGTVPTDQNMGNGYLINGNFIFDKASGDQMLVVYDRNDLTTPVRVAYAPFPFLEFSYTTGTTYSRVDYVYIGSASGPLTQVVRKALGNTHTNDIAALYAIKRPREYYDNGHFYNNYWMALTVEPGNNFTPKHAVKEFLVDINGAPIPVADNERATLLDPGSLYEGNVPTPTGFIKIGYKWDTKPDGTDNGIVKTGNPSKIINKTETIYFVYRVDPGRADVNVSKVISGRLANMIREFTFTVSIKDDAGNPLAGGGPFTLTGSIITNSGATPPSNGVLNLDANGEGTISLKHGQIITIKDIPADYEIKVIEAPDNNYRMYFDDGTGEIERNDTYFRIVGTTGWTFDYRNVRKEVVPAGIQGKDTSAAVIMLSIVSVLFTGVITAKALRRRRMTR